MTNNPSNLPPLKLGIETDDASFSRVEQRTADTFNRINALAKANDSVSQSAQQMGRSLSDAFAAGATKVDANVKSIQALRKEVQGLDSDQKKASGGGSFNVEGLRRTGGALTQLGLGEVGGAVSRIGDIGQVVKQVDSLTESLGPLGLILPVAAGAALGFNAAMLLLHDQAEKNTATIKQTIAQLDSYYAAINQGTTESLKKRQESLQSEKASVDKELSLINTARETAFVGAQKEFGDLGARLLTAAGQTGLYGDTLKETDAKMEELRKKSADLGGQLTGVTDAMKSSEVAANDMKAAEEKLAEARRTAIGEGIKAADKLLQLQQTGTSAQVKEEIARLEREQAAIEKQRPDILKLSVSASQADRDEAQKWIELNNEDAKSIVKLRDNILPLVVAREKETAATKYFFSELKANIDRMAKEVNDRNTRVAGVQQKYEDDVSTIEEKALQKRADIEKKYADKQIEIAQQAADAAASALAKLQQQRDDLATSLGRDEQKAERAAQAKVLDVQINAQREQVKALRDHQRELEQIRKDAYAREVGFLLDRNFLGLYESRLNTSRSIDSSNEKFGASQGDRQQTAQQQIEDLKRNVARERQERLIAYQQQLADAQLAYRREIQAAQQKRVQELALARQTEQAALREAATAAANELRIRQNAYNQELKLAALYGAARVKAEDDIQKALIKRAEQYLSLINGASGGANTPISGDQRRLLQRAGGGALGAGQASLVNDGRGRESFNGVPFPPGLGVFIPAQSGSVSPGQSGPVTLNVYPAPGMDETQLAHKTLDLLEKVIKR
jgi:hypothetical protein